MIQFIMISLLTASGSSYNSLIRAFDDNKHTSTAALTGNDRCQPVIGNAWQCWSKFGNHYMCSDIIRQAWQCFLSKSKYGRRRVKSDWKKPRRSQKPGKHLLQSLLSPSTTTSTSSTTTDISRSISSSSPSFDTSATTSTTADIHAGNAIEEKGQDYGNLLESVLSSSRRSTTTCQNNDDCGSGKTCSPEPASSCCGNGSPIFYFNFFRHIQTVKGVLLFRLPCPCSLKIISNSASTYICENKMQKI